VIGPFPESVVEEAALKWFGALGYAVVAGPSIAAGEPAAERTSYEQVLLEARLSEAERAGWDWLVTRDTVTTAEYQEAMDVPNRTARYHLKRLTEFGLLRVVGAGKATRYEVLRS